MLCWILFPVYAIVSSLCIQQSVQHWAFLAPMVLLCVDRRQLGLLAMMEHAESIPNLQELPLEDAIREKLKDSRELNMLVIGRYQVGKSAYQLAVF